MVIEKKNNKIAIDLVILFCALTGIVLNFNLFKTPVGILYYTIFSNLLCLLFYTYSVIKKLFFNFKLTKNYIKVKGLILVSLVCTFIIYNFVMVPTGQVAAYDGHFWISCIVHIFTPLLVVADCIVNGKRKMLEYKDLLLYLVVIIVYGLIVITYQYFGGLFPDGTKYPYLNFDYEGYGIIYCIIMNLIYVTIYEIIGLIIITINRNVIRNV